MDVTVDHESHQCPYPLDQYGSNKRLFEYSVETTEDYASEEDENVGQCNHFDLIMDNEELKNLIFETIQIERSVNESVYLRQDVKDNVKETMYRQAKRKFIELQSQETVEERQKKCKIDNKDSSF
jgi:hypothetical protein